MPDQDQQTVPKEIDDWTAKEAIKELTYLGVKFVTAVAAAPLVAQYSPMVGITISPEAAQKGLPILLGLLFHAAHDWIKRTYKIPWL